MGTATCGKRAGWWSKAGLLPGLLWALALLAPGAGQAQEGEAADWMLLGNVQYMSGLYDEAAESYRKTSSDSELAPRGRLMLGRALINLEHYGEAFDVLLMAKESGGLSAEEDRIANGALLYIDTYGGIDVAAEIRKRQPDLPPAEADKIWQVYGSLSGDYVTGIARDAALDPRFVPMREEDYRLAVTLGGGLQVPIEATGGTVGVGYDFLQYLYEEFDDLNLQVHRGSATYRQPLADQVSAGAGYDFSANLVDNELELLSVVHHVGTDVFFREAVYLSDGIALFGQVKGDLSFTNFSESEDLDSTTATGSLVQILQYGGPDDYLRVDYTGGVSSAGDDRYSYIVNRVGITGSVALGTLGVEVDFIDDPGALSAGFAYANRDYQGLDSVETTKERTDNSFTFFGSYTVPIIEEVDFFLRYNFLQQNSNIARQDYSSHTASAGVRAAF